MINRQLQLEILTKMRDVYPKKLISFYAEYESASSLHEAKFNTAYLTELELIKESHAGHYAMELMDGQPFLEDAKAHINGKITAKGIDFLEDDGGLSAILGVVTVKLHADTIRDLIDAKIVESDAIPDDDKPALREALKGMKEEGLKQLTTRLVSYGLEQGSISAQQIMNWMGT